ncbi:MAG TPA: DUF1622 domain-containing protein [Herpetosiphonaceae bacterium]|nr:DUF1622 domain-containing protein [Herpetosiphonaceae bacterium]
MEREPRESWANVLLPVALIGGLAALLTLSGGNELAENGLRNPLEPWLKLIVGYLAVAAEMAAALVIGLAVLRSIVAYLGQLLGPPSHGATETVRLRLGRALTLGLEFTLASDILRTAVAPTRQDILNLGAIVLLRTLLNFFLEREIRQAERIREAESGQRSSGAAEH